jgi:hypothetical protein
MTAPLTRAEVVKDIQFLVTVEHARVVEYLSVSYALGADLDARDGGAKTSQGADAARTAKGLAGLAMLQIGGLNRALADAQESPALERAVSIPDASGADLSLAPPTADQLAQLFDREEAIEAAVVARYARLVPAVTTDPVFEGDLLARTHDLITVAADGGGRATGLRETLGALAPADYLVATRRAWADHFEQRLLKVSDRWYGQLLGSLRQFYSFGRDTGEGRPAALNAMDGLDDTARLLVARGLLPPFTPQDV